MDFFFQKLENLTKIENESLKLIRSVFELLSFSHLHAPSFDDKMLYAHGVRACMEVKKGGEKERKSVIYAVISCT